MILNILLIFLTLWNSRVSKYLSYEKYKENTFIQFVNYEIQCMLDDSDNKCIGITEEFQIKHDHNHLICSLTLQKSSLNKDKPTMCSKIIDLVKSDIISIVKNGEKIILFHKVKEITSNEIFWWQGTDFLYRILSRIRIYFVTGWSNFIIMKLSFDSKNIKTKEDYQPFEDILGEHPVRMENSDADILYSIYQPENIPSGQFIHWPDLVKKSIDDENAISKIITLLRLTGKNKQKLFITDQIFHKNKYLRANIKYENENAQLTLRMENKIQYLTKKDGVNELLNCRNNICLNGGVCQLYIDPRTKNNKKFKCICEAGFHGDICELNIKCSNCHSSCNRDFSCDKCKMGWMGPYCTIPDCESFVMCKNSGKCSYDSNSNSFSCNCVNQYTGDYCEIAPSLIQDIKVIAPKPKPLDVKKPSLPLPVSNNRIIGDVPGSNSGNSKSQTRKPTYAFSNNKSPESSIDNKFLSKAEQQKHTNTNLLLSLSIITIIAIISVAIGGSLYTMNKKH